RRVLFRSKQPAPRAGCSLHPNEAILLSHRLTRIVSVSRHSPPPKTARNQRRAFNASADEVACIKDGASLRLTCMVKLAFRTRCIREHVSRTATTIAWGRHMERAKARPSVFISRHSFEKNQYHVVWQARNAFAGVTYALCSAGWWTERRAQAIAIQ